MTKVTNRRTVSAALMLQAALCILISASALAQVPHQTDQSAVGKTEDVVKAANSKNSAALQEPSQTEHSAESPAQTPTADSTVETSTTSPVPDKPGDDAANHQLLAPKAKPPEEGLPLIVGGEEVLRFKATISGFTPAQRIAIIDERIRKLISRPDFDPTKISFVDTGFSTDILCGNSIILTVTTLDASLDGFKDRDQLAKSCAEKLTRTLAAEKLAHSPKVIFIALASTAVATLVLLVVLALFQAVFPRIYSQINSLKGK